MRKHLVHSVLVLAILLSGLVGNFATPAHAAGELAPSRLGEMYQNTGGDALRLLDQLNNYVDRQGGHLAARSGYLGDIPYPAVVWSGAIDEVSGVVVAISKGPGFCVCYVQAPHRVDGEGRYVRLSDYLTPHLDLPGWQPLGGGPVSPAPVVAQPVAVEPEPTCPCGFPTGVYTTPPLLGVMPHNVFTDMWNRTPRNDPAALIGELDNYFNTALPIVGGQGNNLFVEAGSVFWTDPGGKAPYLRGSGAPATKEQAVPLRVLPGDWSFGVYYAEVDLGLYGGGRYARVGPRLNPARDLPGWGS